MVKSPEKHSGYKRTGKPYQSKNEHWEIKYTPEKGKNRANQVMGGDFDPMPSKDRYKNYIPVNETDT